MQPMQNNIPTPAEMLNLYPDFDGLPPGQQRILSSALELFAEKGYASTSTGAIAKQAGVAEGLIFKHFRSKKDLLLQLVRPLILGVFFPLSVRRIQAVMKHEYSHFSQLLEALLRERLEFVTTHHKILRLVMQEIWLHPELRQSLQEQFQYHLQPLIQQRIEAFQLQGQIRQMPYITCFRLIISQLMGFIIPRILLFPDHAWNDEQEIQETLRTLVLGLTPGEES